MLREHLLPWVVTECVTYVLPLQSPARLASSYACGSSRAVFTVLPAATDHLLGQQYTVSLETLNSGYSSSSSGSGNGSGGGGGHSVNPGFVAMGIFFAFGIGALVIFWYFCIHRRTPASNSRTGGKDEAAAPSYEPPMAEQAEAPTLPAPPPYARLDPRELVG